MPHRRGPNFDAYQLLQPAPIANRTAAPQVGSAVSGALQTPATRQRWSAAFANQLAIDGGLTV
jgi:hypothetical protein